MSLKLLDTDMLSLYYFGHPDVMRNVHARPASQLAISIVTVDEQVSGRYLQMQQARKADEIVAAYSRLGEAVVRLSRWRILPLTTKTLARVAQLKAMRLNVGKMDLRIAAIAEENGAVVVTRNRRDFGRIPGLAIEDWSD